MKSAQSPRSEAVDKKLTPEQREIAFLKGQLNGFSLILSQNAALEEEVHRLNRELDTATLSIVKRGYLYKWREHEIGWASKWGLRYFSLQGATLSYYGDETEPRPRRTFDLSQCIVRNEGTKKNGLFHVISLYLTHAVDAAEDTLDDSFADYNEDYSPALTLVIRVSTQKKADAQQWLEVLEQACAMKEISAHHAAAPPTLEFPSSPSIDPRDDAEMKDENNEREAYGEDSAPRIEDDDTTLPSGDLSPVLLKRVRSSNLALQKSSSRQSLARKVLSARSGNFKGTEEGFPQGRHEKLPIGGGGETTGLHQRKGFKESADVAISGAGNTSLSRKPREIKDFPAYKPMHTKSQWSPLSNEVRPGEMNYRGFFNLALIVLVLSNIRIIVDSHTKYGFYPAWRNILTATEEYSSLFHWALSKPGISVLSWCTQILVHWRLEKFFRYTSLSERYILAINFIFGIANIVVPVIWVWDSSAHWGGRMVYLFQSVIMWMKLISYAHANKDLRKSLKISMARKQSSDSLASFDDNKKPVAYSATTDGMPTYLQEVKDIQPPYLKYPQNLTLGNLSYFIVAPTLTYQLNYPESARTRWKHVLLILFRMIIASGLILFGVEQYIKPNLMQAVTAVENKDILLILEKILRISIPNTYVWLLGFYFYFHLWLNLCAELTRFGDRQFYKDWWNARTIETYWRNWNLPVHNWMLKHLYYPMLRAGFGKLGSTFIVFFFSAVAHEVIISVPFRHVGMHAFAGMLIQAPLTYLTKFIDRRFDNAFFGNSIFWFCFCIFGQPLGVILIAHDHWSALKQL